MRWFYRLIKDQRGYGAVEVLMLAAGAIAISGAVYFALKDIFIMFHETAVDNITDITNSGQ